MMTPDQIDEMAAILNRMASMLVSLPKEAKGLIAGLSNQVTRLRADIERIGRERDELAHAAQELQERLSALEDDLK